MLVVGYSRAAAPQSGLAVGNFVAQADQSHDTTAQLALPAGISAGSTLVAVLRYGFWSGAAPASVTPPAGWTLVAQNTSGSGIYVYRKTAVGTEGGTTVSWTSEARVCGFVFAEVSGAKGTVEAAFAPASLDPPAHAPTGGVDETVWIAVTSTRRNDNDITAAPAGYGGFAKAETSPNNSSNAAMITIGGAYRQARAASEAPGPFAWAGASSNGPQACTISVR
jgi:hypothetical protein